MLQSGASLSGIILLIFYSNICFADFQVYEINLRPRLKEITVVVYCAEGITDCNDPYVPAEILEEAEGPTEFDADFWMLLLDPSRSPSYR